MTEAQHFGRYRVTKTLGSGAMGAVYEAVDDVLGREVAIKTLKAANGITARMIDDRFRTEARAIAQLSHPGVVGVFDVDVAADPPYIVLERVAGPSLDERLANTGPLPSEEVVALGIQIARALAAAHAAGIVHRDVKPSNILGAGPRVWKLADFGVAHVPDSSLTMTGQFVGSPAYASPEALVKGASTAGSDVYSLGATLYQAAAGKWPRLEANGAILAPVPPLAELAPQTPAHVAAAIDRAVALEPDRRPTANELADLLAGAVAVAPPPSPPPPSPVITSSTTGATAAIATSTIGAPPMQWKPWVIGGVIAVFIGFIVATRSSSGPATADEIRAEPPQGIEVNPRAVKDWNKVVDQLRRQHFGEARHKLDDWERKWGATPETKALHETIDTLPDRGDNNGRDD